MGVVWVCLMISGGLPAISNPELLLDIDDTPSGVAQLVDANAQGALYEAQNKDATQSLWWITWEGSPFQVHQRPAGLGPITSAALGAGFVIFVPEGGGTQSLLSLSLEAEPRVDQVTTVPGPVSILDSSSRTRVWWVDDQGTSSTDGTLTGTVLEAPNLTPTFEAGGALYSWSWSDQLLMRWKDGALVDAGWPARSVKRAGVHALVADRSLYNELGELLVKGTNCVAFSGGETAWANCATDAGVMTWATDGTVTGTRPRFGPFGNFVTGDLATSDYLLAPVSSTGGGCTLVTGRDGPLNSFPACDGRILGDVLVRGRAAVSLLPPFSQVPLEPWSSARAAARRALVRTQAGFRLTDGTPAGTIEVPAHWPESMVTTSSSPRLLSSNGDRALYATTRGVWVTDGSRAGTFRVGDSAVLWGKSVLASERGAMITFDPAGKSWVPPQDVVGPARGQLISRVGCEAFRIDESHQRHPIAVDGCVETVSPGEDGALIATAEGAFFLVRDERVHSLGTDVWPESTVRCTQKRCWFLGAPQVGFYFVKSLELESAAVRTGPSIPRPDDPRPIVLWGVSERAAITGPAGGGLNSITFLGGGQAEIASEPKWAFASDGSVLLLSSLGLSVASGPPLQPPSALLSFSCQAPIGVSVAGASVHALCEDWIEGGLRRTLRSGTVEGGLTQADAGSNPMLPEGDELAWATLMLPGGQPVIQVQGAGESREFSDVYGGQFARVREGVVFAGSGLAVDEELWVSRIPPSGCGCGSPGGVLWLLTGAWFLRRRREAGLLSGACLTSSSSPPASPSARA